MHHGQVFAAIAGEPRQRAIECVADWYAVRPSRRLVAQSRHPTDFDTRGRAPVRASERECPSIGGQHLLHRHCAPGQRSVLSLAMIVHAPSLLIAESESTMTCPTAIRAGAAANATVTAICRPSGIVDTASATASSRISSPGYPYINKTNANGMIGAIVATLICCASRSSRTTNDGGVAFAIRNDLPIVPSAVSAPVPTTPPIPRSCSIIVPGSTIVVCGPGGVRPGSSAA